MCFLGNPPDGDGNGPSLHALPPEVAVHFGHLVLVHLVQLGVDLLAGVDDVLLQQLLGNLLHAGKGGGGGEGLLRLLHVVMFLLLSIRVGGHVGGDNEPCQVLVLKEIQNSLLQQSR